MAIFHLHIQVIGRGKGSSKMVKGKLSAKSAIAAAAYRAACKLVDTVVDRVTGKETIRTYDYRNKPGLAHSEILAPSTISKDAWVYDRQQLWAAVQDRELRKDSRFAREFDIALPKELSKEENVALLRDYVEDVYVSKGMIADMNIHYDNPENPHAHVMLTTRDLVIGKDGTISFGLKNLSWEKTSLVLEAREKWSQAVNHELELRGFTERISHKSYAELGIDLAPTKHEGASRHMQGIIFQDNLATQTENLQYIVENPEVVINTMNKAVFTKADLEQRYINSLKAVLPGASGTEVTSKYLYGLEKMMSTDALVRLEQQTIKGEVLYTSKHRLNIEQQYVEDLQALNASERFKLTQESIKLPDHLSNKQQEVVMGVLQGQDISIIEGLPGAGKTTVMKAIAENYQEQGYNIVGASISSVATLNLQEAAGIEARTIASWKYRLNQNPNLLGDKTVFVIDEASMLDFDSAARLLDYLQDSKVIMVGDTNQFGAIGIKGAMAKAVEICGALGLNEVRRQQNVMHREAAIALGKHDVERALKLYEQSGAFKVSEKNAQQVLVLDYVQEYTKNPQTLITEEMPLILAFTNDKVKELNQEVRAKLKETGVLKNEQMVKFGQHHPTNLELAVGDQVIFCANDRNIGVLNGELGKVQSIKLNKEGYGHLTVQLKDKQIEFASSDYTNLKHGYALTSHKSQGATYKTTRVLYEPMIKYHAFNVMMTRHTDDVGLYINRTDLLANTYAIKDQVKYRSSDFELIRDKLLAPLHQRESSLLASDYLQPEQQEKFEKVREFIELKNDLRLLIRDDYQDIRLDAEVAKKYLNDVTRKDQLATEMKDNYSAFKDFIAAGNISLGEKEPLKHHIALDKMREVDMSPYQVKKKLNKWYEEQKTLKEQALILKSQLIIKQETLDEFNILQKQEAYITSSAQAMLDEGLVREVFKEKAQVVVYEKLEQLASKSLEQQLVEYARIKQNPNVLGTVAGFEVFGLKTSSRKDALEKWDNYVDHQITATKLQQRLAGYSMTTETLSKDIDAMQQDLSKLEVRIAAGQEFQVARAISQQNKKDREELQAARIIKNTQSSSALPNSNMIQSRTTYLRFDDVKLSAQDHEGIFRQCVHLLNPNDNITKVGNEIKCGSLTMNIQKGLWQRFATGESGNIYTLICQAKGMNKREALEWVASEKNLSVTNNIIWDKNDYLRRESSNQLDRGANNVVKADWQQLAKIPAGIELNPMKDLRWFKAQVQEIYPYKDIEGNLLGYTLRCIGEDGKKQILPLSYCVRGNMSQWMIKGFGNHLYGAEKLAQGQQRVLIVEGEKTANAAQQLFPDYAVVGFAGTNRVNGIDWSILKDREVTIWPDNDHAGKKAATELTSILDQAGIKAKTVELDTVVGKQLPEKWDLADKLPEGVTIHHLRELVDRTGCLEVQPSSTSNVTIMTVGLENALSLVDQKLEAKIVSASNVQDFKNYLPQEDERIIIAVNNPELLPEISKVEEELCKSQVVRVVEQEGNDLSTTVDYLASYSRIEVELLTFTFSRKREEYQNTVETFWHNNQPLLNDLAKLNPSYDFTALQKECSYLPDSVREQLLENECHKALKNYVVCKESELRAAKGASQSFNELLDVYKEERGLCQELAKSGGELALAKVERELGVRYVSTVNLMHNNQEQLIENFTRDVKLLDKLGIQDMNSAFVALKSSENLSTEADKAFEKCKDYVLDKLKPVVKTDKLEEIVAALQEKMQVAEYEPYIQELYAQKSAELLSYQEQQKLRVENLIEVYKQEVGLLKEFNPQYNLKVLKDHLGDLSNTQGQKLIESEVNKMFGTYLTKEQEALALEKNTSKSFTELLTVFEKEKQFCQESEVKYKDLLADRPNDYIREVNLWYNKNPELLDNLKRDTIAAEKFSLVETHLVFRELQQQNNPVALAQQLFTKCEQHVLMKLAPELELCNSDLKQTVTLLERKMQDQLLAPYLREITNTKAIELTTWQDAQLIKSKEHEVQKGIEIEHNPKEAQKEHYQVLEHDLSR